jgi:hypothetical protein
MSSISAGTTTGTALVSAGDTTGELLLKTNGSTTAVTISTGQQVQVNTGGSASAPVISKSDDTNTGIFFPAADTIAFAEGGAEVARFDSSGNLGIGTTTAPAGGLLTLNRAPTAAFGSPILQVGGASFTSGGYYSVGLGFTDATYTEPPAEIAYVSTSDSGGTKGAIVFGTRDVTTNTAVSERMRIDSSGNLLFNSGYGSVATAFGCRAWVNFNGMSGSVAIRASGNISSVTRTAQGVYTVSFTNALADANYSMSGTAERDDGLAWTLSVSPSPASTQTASDAYICTGYAGSQASQGLNIDAVIISVQFFR